MEVKQAKAFSTQNKKREALTCIKRKKMYEKQLDQITNAKITMETQKLSLEAVNINAEVIATQKYATSALTAGVKAMGGVDAVEELADNTEEALADADEIGQAMSRPINAGSDATDDDLLAELEQLENDSLDEALLATNHTIDDGQALPSMPEAPFSAPSVPTRAPATMTDEERELAELEASMAMG